MKEFTLAKLTITDFRINLFGDTTKSPWGINSTDLMLRGIIDLPTGDSIKRYHGLTTAKNTFFIKKIINETTNEVELITFARTIPSIDITPTMNVIMLDYPEWIDSK